jgi:hypothetical protein
MAHQAQFLVDDADPQVARGARRRNVHLDASEQDAAFVLGVDPGQDFHQRGLASPVFATQRVHFTGVQLEFAIVERMDAREELVDSFHTDQIA